MKKHVQNIIISFAVLSNPIFLIGLGLILGVTFWDILKTGWTKFYEYRIGPAGIIIIWFGIALCSFAWSSDKRLRPWN